MSDPLLFTADHNGFYHNDVPFFPYSQAIQDCNRESNVTLIQLPARLSDDLDWAKEMVFAAQIASSGKYILWEIDLALPTFQFSPDDSAAFYSFSVALEAFTAKIWPAFQEHTFGVVLYRGGFQPSHCFPLFRWESAYTDWMRDLPQGTSYDLYCAQILAEYLHRLISFLPDPIIPFAFIDVRESGSSAKVAQLFSKERFEHIHLALKGAKFPFQGITWKEGYFCQEAKTPALLGIYLPNDAHVDANVIGELDRLIADLNQSQTAFRIIPEGKLTEQWDGLDELIVPKHPLSAQGNRKLQGFIAAGGIIRSLDSPNSRL